jgi:hypothetical protein
VDRARVWLAVSPLMAAGVVGAHALAYRITGTPTGELHHYLGHTPQVLLVLALAGLALGSFGARLRVPPAWPFPAAALGTFVVQEHVERLAHGELPLLLGSRVFLVGLILQIPVALLVWGLARRLLASLQVDGARRRSRLPRLAFVLMEPATSGLRTIAPVVPRGRGPPYLQTP